MKNKKRIIKLFSLVISLFITIVMIFFNTIAYTNTLDNKVKEDYKEEIKLVDTPKDEKEISLIELKKKLMNKNISILGDSISTYENYSNDSLNTNSTIGDNVVFYDGRIFINSVNETWWMQAINQTGMKLLVNNSSAGDAVTWKAIERSQQLHNNVKSIEEKPDIIAVYIGINDIKDGIPLDEFKKKYLEMVYTMRTTYVDAEIFLFTHVPYTCYNVARSIISPEELEWFNNVIRDIANNVKNCNIVDLYNDSEIKIDNYKTFMGDQGLHPNALGMDKITDAFVNALIKKYVY